MQAVAEYSAMSAHPARPTLYLTVGLPGAGKTTAALEIAAREGILRLTPDEWMAPLFHHHDPDGRRSILEGRMIDVARQVLLSGSGAILDFGCWSPEERWAIRAIAEACGARFQMIVADIDEGERRRRAHLRWLAAPETTFEISEAEHDSYRDAIRLPALEEQRARELPPVPSGFRDWGEWAAQRWPTLPSIRTSA